ncbi:ATP-binding cassette domain-containing protein [Candidatus Peribacteria bacterium]|nr:ATP-binding cassette domain-containing protein [Candidatus Peribacteria bacterium]MBT4021141.1 ATP-binding cassette domain-containing protein [Candidatus Peribacteria bacterium]MBT4240360.1 ATP-binding cassette domain-containing protein [Candidatus Peribacteria bacterium]MBT4473742.1 ATP-binding cassette domain-containing protein [Candidatus Peribacteria bacterium]
MISFDHVSLNVTSGTALKDISLDIDPGEFLCIVGSSGSGKSLLLSLLTGESSPNNGKVTVDKINIHNLPRTMLQVYRREIGILKQGDDQLLPDRSIAANIAMALEARKMRHRDIAEMTTLLLMKIGMIDRASCLPEELNRGERARVAIAQAIANSPKILLADEPMGDLDTESSDIIRSILTEMNQSGSTVILTTHNPKTIEDLKARTVRLEKGEIIQKKIETKTKIKKLSDRSIQPNKISPKAS